MSADNGIYVLKTSDQYRVIYASAIDNLSWSYVDGGSNAGLVPTRVVEYFGNTRYTRNSEQAQKVAYAMSKQYPVLEYGISTIQTHKSWSRIVREAKEYAKLEIQAIKNNNKEWQLREIHILEKIIEL